MSEVGVTSFIDFDTAANLLLTQRRKARTTFFGDKIPHLESVFWKLGCVQVLRSHIRILRASLMQIDTEMTKIYSNQRYAVDAVSINTHMSNTARYSSGIAFFAYPTCI